MSNDPTTDPIVELSSDGELIHDLSHIAAGIGDPLDEAGGLYARALPPGWTLATLDLVHAIGLAPRMKEGGPELLDATSFCDYVKDQDEFDDGRARFYFEPVDIQRDAGDTVTAVFDDHVGGDPGHAAHRARLRLNLTDDFRQLIAADGGYVSAREFAEWVTDYRYLIVEPDAGEILDMVRSFKATKFATIEEGHNEGTGDMVLHYETETQTSGDLIVPEYFTFSVSVFQGEPASTLVARFRYDVESGRPRFGFRIEQLTKQVDLARLEMLDRLSTQLDSSPIRRGTPPRTR